MSTMYTIKFPSSKGKKIWENKSRIKSHTLIREWVPTSYAIKFPNLEWTTNIEKKFTHTHKSMSSRYAIKFSSLEGKSNWEKNHTHTYTHTPTTIGPSFRVYLEVQAQRLINWCSMGILSST
jgi:hypothetical protein